MPASVSIESLSFAYRNAGTRVLKDLSAQIEEGTFIALMGHSGAGKSTLCCAMNGLVPRFFRGNYDGRVTVEGKKVTKCGIVELSKMVGLVLQDFEAQLFSTNVELEIAFGPENQMLSREIIRERIDRYLSFVGLEGERHRDSSTLSGGQKQRLAIGSVLAMEPRVLVMDEPVTDLDPKGREAILSISGRLRDQKRTLVVVDNEYENIIKADRIWLMKEGEIVAQDSSASILSNAPLLESCGVMAPPTVSLFHAMSWPGSPFTFEDAKSLLKEGNLVTRREKSGFEECHSPRKGNPLLEARDLSFQYPGSLVLSLRNINLVIHEGEFVAILGENGSGKTTLAKHLNGLLTPVSGEMLVESRPTRAYRKPELARQVGYVFQNPDHQIFAPSVREEVGFGLKIRGEKPGIIEENVGRALAATGLEGYEDKSPFLLARGERERVAVASVLAVKPRVIILDEPTTGLDYAHQLETMRMLKSLNEEGHIIIIITHAMWIAESFATRTIVMRQGEIITDGPTRRVFADERGLSETSLVPSALVRLSNWLGTASLTVEGMVKELQS